MKLTRSLLWLFSASVLFTAEAQADLILAPESGLSRETVYGISGGPSGITSQTYVDDTNAALYGGYDGRYPVGSNSDNMLLYNLQGLGGVAPSEAMLTFQMNSVLCNGSPNPPFDTYVSITVAGTNNSTLGAADYTATPALTTGFEIAAGVYNGTVSLNMNMSSVIANLVGEGFSYATILLQTFASTTQGPSLVEFTQAPTMDITQGSQNSSAGTLAVPEASSIVQLGVAMVGLFLFMIFRSPRAF